MKIVSDAEMFGYRFLIMLLVIAFIILYFKSGKNSPIELNKEPISVIDTVYIHDTISVPQYIETVRQVTDTVFITDNDVNNEKNDTLL